MKDKVAIVFNPRSRYLKHHPQSMTALFQLAPEASLVTESKSVVHLEHRLRQFLDLGANVFAIAGGDGTVGLTIGLIRAACEEKGIPLPRVALLQGGTMNTVSRSMGLKQARPEQHLEALLLKLKTGEGKLREQRSLEVEGKLGFLFGTGVFQAFMKAYYEAGKDEPSPLTAAKVIGRAAVSAMLGGSFSKGLTETTAFRLFVDGEELETRDYMAVTAGTVSEVGLGFSPYYLSEGAEEAFHLLTITGKASAVALDLPKVWRGKPLRESNGQNYLAKRVRLERPGGQSIPYMMDGDLGEADGTLEIGLGPKIPFLL